MNLWTLEWSEKQNCFHVDKLERIIAKNIDMYSDGVTNQYSLIGVFDSHDEAHEFMEKVKKYRMVKL